MLNNIPFSDSALVRQHHQRQQLQSSDDDHKKVSGNVQNVTLAGDFDDSDLHFTRFLSSAYIQ